MYAVVEYKGNQYKAEKDAVLRVSKISDAKKGDTVTIDTVLLVSDGNNVKVGTQSSVIAIIIRLAISAAWFFVAFRISIILNPTSRTLSTHLQYRPNPA